MRKESQLNTILVLFLILRLTILIFYSQEGPFNVYTDYYYYYRTAQLSDQGYYPFINMWYEYPPLLAYLPQLAYWLAGSVLPMGDLGSMGYQVFEWLLGVILLVFDAGSLILLHAIGKRLWGVEKANWLAWVYACLSLPLFFLTYVHQVVALFFMLLAIYAFLETQPRASALALGLGVVSKFTPFILIPPVVRFLWPQRGKIIQYLLVFVLVLGLAYTPFFVLGGGEWVLASFQALARVGSYGTVWAILDGNWGPGTYGVLTNRLDFAQASLVHSNPAVVPNWLVTLITAAIYAWLFFKKKLSTDNPQHFIWFATLTAVIFHLWSRGWSPHWAMMLIPLYLLSSPDRRGLNWVLLLTGTVFIEWPFLIVSGSHLLAGFFIVVRTALFIYTAVYLFRQLAQSSPITS